MIKKMEAFREILLRKTQHDPLLHTLIQHMGGEILAKYAIESLEKMAEKKDIKGRKLNSAAQDFAKDLTPGHVAMIHDALSHHATRMKAALKAGDKEAAGEHSKRLVNTMNTAQRLALHSEEAGDKEATGEHSKPLDNTMNTAQHSDRKLKVDAVDFKPWDQNTFPKHKRGEGKKRADYTQAKGWHSLKGNDGPALLDAMTRGPHWSYEHSDPKTFREHKDQPYPIDKIKINGKFLHIDDNHVHSKEGDNSHEFDSHPIHDIVMTPDDALGPDARQKFLNSTREFHDSKTESPQKRWIARQKALRGTDPKYQSRGLEPSKGLSDYAQPSHPPTLHEKHENYGKPQAATETSASSPSVIKRPAASAPADSRGGNDHIMWGDKKVNKDNVHEHLSGMLSDANWLKDNHAHLPKLSGWLAGKKGS